MDIAFITGINGQDGSYLTRFLLDKGYTVHGMIRRSSSINTHRIDDVYKDIHENNVNLFLHYGDMCDSSCITNLIYKIKPTEVYNLAAMSHVKISFEIPEYTGDVDAIGTLRLLEAIKNYEEFINYKYRVKFYNAATSELYGGIYNDPQDENTPFCPKSPYAVAKLYSYWITCNYRESYDMFCCNGILFNHTSIYRGHNFVEQKIVKAAVKISKNLQDCLYLGNLYASRDIGHAKDYVKAMWMMLNYEKPDDYVISTGVGYTIKEIVEMVFNKLYINIQWEGTGINEVGKFKDKIIIRIDHKYFRPSEVVNLLGNSNKAKTTLGWNIEYNLDKILDEMILNELKINQL